MDEMIGYIFGSLKSSEDAVKRINKTLCHQAKINQTRTLFTFAVTVYIVAAELHNYERNKKIEELSNEIKELKRMKGE